MRIKRPKMRNFCGYISLVILLFFITKTCITDDSSATDGVSGSEDDSSESGLDFDPDVCGLPIDAGDCGAKNLKSLENSLNDNAIKYLYEINDDYEVKQLYEANKRLGLKLLKELNEPQDINERYTRYFGYNRDTQKCEEFNFDGCGGNDNRFSSLTKCKKTCYNPLKYFLSEVTDLLLFRFNNITSEVPAM